MADFLIAYERMIQNEGGYKLTNDSVDRGGMTYAGISRKMNPQWAGWSYIDRGEIPPTQMVRDFYKAGWWDPIMGDQIEDQEVAQNLFDFGVNTSAFGRPKVAVKLAQLVVGATPDGDFGPKTLERINFYPAELFKAQYALAKVARYRDIVAKDRSQIKYLVGWINRTLKEAA